MSCPRSPVKRGGSHGFIETLKSDECAGGAIGHIGCENCHGWLLCGPDGPAGIPCGWLYGTLLGPADTGGYIKSAVDILDPLCGCLGRLGPATEDIEISTGCLGGVGGVGGWVA